MQDRKFPWAGLLFWTVLSGLQWMRGVKKEASLSSTTITSKEYFDREVKIYEIYRDYIKAEDSLRTSRTTAFLTIQTILLAGLGVILGTEQSVRVAAERVTFANSYGVIIILVGIITCFHMLFRDVSMRRTMGMLDAKIKEFEECRNVPIELGTLAKENAFWLRHLPRAHVTSGKPVRYTAFHNIFLCLWIVTLVSYVLYLAGVNLFDKLLR
jgi:hypothetical protein